eukprot:1653149-Pleurochrysis_carterae.AAC.2
MRAPRPAHAPCACNAHAPDERDLPALCPRGWLVPSARNAHALHARRMARTRPGARLGARRSRSTESCSPALAQAQTGKSGRAASDQLIHALSVVKSHLGTHNFK